MSKMINEDKQPMKQENERLQLQIEKIENDKSELIALYERDKILWE